MATKRHKKYKKRYINPLSCVSCAFLWLNVFILAGCAPKLQKPMRICPGKKSAAESLSLITSASQNAVPLKAIGQCRLQYYDDEGKKHRKENFPVKIWFDPPNRIRLHGDIAFNPRGLDIGSDENEFWLAMKPKEISTYQWGKWSEQSSSDRLLINPETLLETFGITAIDTDRHWSLSSQGAFDVLIRHNEQALPGKKIYVYNCDERVRKIEYIDADEQVIAVTELDKYKRIAEGFFVPSAIKITRYADDGSENSVRITLKSIKPADFTDKQRNILFTRPVTRGYRHIYKIVDGNVIEQMQE